MVSSDGTVSQTNRKVVLEPPISPGLAPVILPTLDGKGGSKDSSEDMK